MPTATQNETRDTAFACHAAPRNEFAAASEVRQSSAGDSRLSGDAARLADLLAEDPVDLARISDEIRAQPALANVIQHVAVLLQVAPGASVGSVEEAAVFLGVDRLRVLLHAFPAIVKLHRGIVVSGSAGGEATSAANGQSVSGEIDTGGPVAEESVESVYFASFVRLLAFYDEGSGALLGEGRLPPVVNPSEVDETMEILLRDVLASVPRINKERRKDPESQTF